LKQFKETKRNYLNPNGKKYGLGEDDFKKGIRTIDEKLESECPQFNRLDKLFGSRNNVLPTFTFEPTVPNEATTTAIVNDVDEEDDDDDDDEDSVISDFEVLVAEDGGRTVNTVSTASNTRTEDGNLSSLTNSPPTTALPANVPTTGLAALVSAAVATVTHKMVAKAMKKKRTKGAAEKAANNRPVIPEVLQQKCSETAKESAEDPVNKLSLQHKKSRKDFTTAFAESRILEIERQADTRTKELELQVSRFEWEKENSQFEAKNKMRQAVVLQLLQSNKTPTEVNEYLAALGLQM
jgi:hypothetical protein